MKYFWQKQNFLCSEISFSCNVSPTDRMPVSPFGSQENGFYGRDVDPQAETWYSLTVTSTRKPGLKSKSRNRERSSDTIRSFTYCQRGCDSTAFLNLFGNKSKRKVFGQTSVPGRSFLDSHSPTPNPSSTTYFLWTLSFHPSIHSNQHYRETELTIFEVLLQYLFHFVPSYHYTGLHRILCLWNHDCAVIQPKQCTILKYTIIQHASY